MEAVVTFGDVADAYILSEPRLQLRVVDDPKTLFTLRGSGQTLAAGAELPRTPDSDWEPASPSDVLDSYWRFCAERFVIYIRRLSGMLPPWTTDPILQHYRFTNVFRATDRVSQYLIRNVIYTGEWSPEDTFFRIMLFKLFNRVETWQHLEQTVGSPQWRTFNFERYARALSTWRSRGKAVYSAAYIIPPTGAAPTDKFIGHLRLLEQMMTDRLPAALGRARTMADVFELLRSYRGLGDFLAYQYTIDLNYSELIDFPESEFVVAGPGARDGIHKCFASRGPLSDADVIRRVCARQELEPIRLGVPVVTLWGRPLQLIDCQNLFCEVGKYARVAHPTVVGRSKRTRIKQRYRLGGRLDAPWFPPKWGLNAKVAEWCRTYVHL